MAQAERLLRIAAASPLQFASVSGALSLADMLTASGAFPEARVYYQRVAESSNAKYAAEATQKLARLASS